MGSSKESAIELSIERGAVRERIQPGEDELGWSADRDGRPRALVAGPQGDEIGYLTVLCVVDPGHGDSFRLAIPTLPPFRGKPLRVFAPAFESGIDEGSRAAFLRGVPREARSTTETTKRGFLQIERLGPRIERTEGWRYYVGREGIYGQPAHGAREEHLLVLPHAITDIGDWMYFVEPTGELARAPRFQFRGVMHYVRASEAERAALLDI